MPFFVGTDVQYTIDRIMNPPKGMVSPRGPVFAALIERVEYPTPIRWSFTAMGRRGCSYRSFANGLERHHPKHIVEKDPVNALKTTVIVRDRFGSKNRPPHRCGSTNAIRSTFRKIGPFSMQSRSIIMDGRPGSRGGHTEQARLLVGFVPPSNMDRDMCNRPHSRIHLDRSSARMVLVYHLTMQPRSRPSMTCVCAQAISEALQREALVS